jgi:ribosomal protein S18 acetylase RimI-like enzyme
MNPNTDIQYRPMQPEDFAAVLQLGNLVHGEGYLTPELLQQYFERGLAQQQNASFVAYAAAQQLVGFRLAFAAGQWQLDHWCSPELWPVSPEKVAYFKCNTVSPAQQGGGIGGQLLQLSIQALQQQGAIAGLAHLWQQSPGNAAVKYFSRHGGVLIRQHPDKWRAESLLGYACVRCGFDCHCSAAEMILLFSPAS